MFELTLWGPSGRSYRTIYATAEAAYDCGRAYLLAGPLARMVAYTIKQL